MLQHEMMKYQSMTVINKLFISGLRKSYPTISVGSYLVERLLHNGLDTGYLCNTMKEYTPFYRIASKQRKFRISVSSSEQGAMVNAINNNHYSVALSTSRIGYNDISSPLYRPVCPKIMLVSFFDKHNQLKISSPSSNIIHSKYTVVSPYRFPILMEYMLDQLKLGHTHLNIENSVLDDPVDLDDVGYHPKVSMFGKSMTHKGL